MYLVQFVDDFGNVVPRKRFWALVLELLEPSFKREREVNAVGYPEYYMLHTETKKILITLNYR